MRHSLSHILTILFIALSLVCCTQHEVSEGQRLTLEVDTLRFDTVFTGAGSATRIVKLYNRNKNALTIRQVKQEKGKYFLFNLDGESDPEYLQNIRLAGGDSLYLFVRADIRPDDSDSPVLCCDRLVFDLSNGVKQTLELEAYGQNVQLVDSLYLQGDTLLSSRRPYLVKRCIVVAPKAHVRIEPGTTFYMHAGAYILAEGSLEAEGTADRRVRFQPDRTDEYLPGIPYLHKPGQWEGIYLSSTAMLASKQPEWTLRSTDILSAEVGLFAECEAIRHPLLTLEGCRIHNMNQYGLVCQGVDAEVTNSEISNCASYCVYLRNGKHNFYHTTVASFFRHTYYTSSSYLYSQAKEDVPAVYINNAEATARTVASFYNSIIDGTRKDELTIATDTAPNFHGQLVGCYLRTDTLPDFIAPGNRYAQPGDTVFRNNYYADLKYYDFHLDSLSCAKAIADSAIAQRYPLNFEGQPRRNDAGCY